MSRLPYNGPEFKIQPRMHTPNLQASLQLRLSQNWAQNVPKTTHPVFTLQVTLFQYRENPFDVDSLLYLDNI